MTIMVEMGAKCEAGQRYLVVTRGGQFGGRFADPDGACHTGVQGSLDSVGERHLFPVGDRGAAVALAERLRGEAGRRCEVLEVELTQPYGGIVGHPWWRYRKVALVHAARMPIPAPASRPRTAEQIWAWLRQVAEAQNETAGSVMSPDITVGELESHCGPGAMARLAKWSDRKGGFSVRAAAVLPIREAYRHAVLGGAKTAEWVEEYATGYWIPKYGEHCHHTREDGEPVLPTDQVHIHYTQVG